MTGDRLFVVSLLGAVGAFCMSASVTMLYGAPFGWLMFGSFCMLGVVLALFVGVK